MSSMPYLAVAGHHLEYKWIGSGPDKTPTLVFLHEGLGCLAMWKDFPAQVVASTGCGAFLYSRHGYGTSDPMEGPRTLRYLHDEALLVLPEVLRKTEIRHPILIGHSDGASIALIYAGHSASDRLGLVLEAPHVFVEDVTVEGMAQAGEIYHSSDLPQKLARYHGEQADAVFQSWYDTWLNPDFRAWNIEEYLPRITCPVMIIQGEDDEYGTGRQVDAVRSQVSGPAEVLMLPNCGHAPHRDQAEATLTAMVRYIRQML